MFLSTDEFLPVSTTKNVDSLLWKVKMPSQIIPCQEKLQDLVDWNKLW